MRSTSWILGLFTLAAAVAISQPAAATSPFTEHFTMNNANWFVDSAGTIPTTFQAAGGPDGSSHISHTASAFGLPDDTPFVLFRANDEFNSSGHAFEGNWLASGIARFSAFVRHDAPTPLTFFARFTRPTGGQGVAAEKTMPVPANTWTKLSFDISTGNIFNATTNPTGELVLEGAPSLFGTVFGNVGHIQIGYSVPAGFGANQESFLYKLDMPSIVPEPASWLLALGGAAAVLGWRRRHSG